MPGPDRRLRVRTIVRRQGHQNLLPEEHERQAVLAGLEKLIEARGFETFVGAPLIEPDARFFPDPWEPSERGVRALGLSFAQGVPQLPQPTARGEEDQPQECPLDAGNVDTPEGRQHRNGDAHQTCRDVGNKTATCTNRETASVFARIRCEG
jgi:hypothetical protein